jgi:hypothetical protein
MLNQMICPIVCSSEAQLRYRHSCNCKTKSQNKLGDQMENAKIEKLLKQNIEASNRTTYAVRAFVGFLFIQLVGITAAFFLNSLATASVDPIECAYSGDNCEPIVALQVLAFFIWIGAVIWSSSVGWKELALSDPRPKPALSTEPSEKISTEKKSTMPGSSCQHCGANKENLNKPCYECGM